MKVKTTSGGVWDITDVSTYIMGVLEGEEWEESILKEIMTENITILLKNDNLCIKETVYSKQNKLKYRQIIDIKI